MQGVLAHAWVPWVTEQSIEVHTWFLSAMVPFWALFGLTLRMIILQMTTFKSIGKLMLFLAFIPWLSFIFPEIYRPEDEHGQWYAVHQHGSLRRWVDVLVVFLKFNPLCYFHVFLFGMCLARMRERLKVALEASGKQQAHVSKTCHLFILEHVVIGWGTAIGYTMLLCIFTLQSLQPYAWKISTRLGLLMIPQGLVQCQSSSLRTYSPFTSLILCLCLHPCTNGLHP